MCPYLRNRGMIAISLVSVSAFCPPASYVGRVTSARAKTTVVAYVDNADAKDKRISELEAENLNLQFKMISDKIDDLDCKIGDVKVGLEDKIDGVDRKIGDVKVCLEDKIDGVDRKIGEVKVGLEDKIDGVDRKIDDAKVGLEDKIDGITKELTRVDRKIDDVKVGLVVIACLCVAPQLSTILAFFK